MDDDDLIISCHGDAEQQKLRRASRAATERKIFMMDDYFLSSYPRIAGQTVAGISTANNCFRNSDPDPRAIYCGPYKKMKMPAHATGTFKHSHAWFEV